MALPRDKWKGKVSKRLFGGLGEWYKYKVAERAGLGRDPKNGHLVDHWRREAYRLVGPDLIDAYETNLKGGKRKAAFDEVVLQLRSGDAALRRWAKRVVEVDFKTNVEDGASASDLEEYIALALETVS